MKQKILNFFLIINRQTLILAILALASTFLCIRFDFKADFPFSLIATSIVFPIVFSIGGAYKRREAALKEYAIIKGYLRSIYFVPRDWMANPDPESVKKLRMLIRDFFSNFRIMFTNPKKDLPKNEGKIYNSFSEFSLYIKSDLRDNGLSTGECSRTNQYLSKIITSYESIKHIYQYRTPISLRSFSSLFINILPIIYGPYFAHMAAEMSFGLAYVTPVLLTMILVGLENIQEHLENPFDLVGQDDIKFNVEKFVEFLPHQSDQKSA